MSNADILIDILKTQGASAMLQAGIAIYRKMQRGGSSEQQWDRALRESAQQYRDDIRDGKVTLPNQTRIKA